MADETSTVTNQAGTKKPTYEIISKPSEVIKSIEKEVDIDRVRLTVTLITMKRSLLLVINSADECRIQLVDPDDLVRGFSASNSPLLGLSLALGKHNTTILESSNSLDSASLATKLSEKLNLNRPVYVANNFQIPYDFVNPDNFMSKLYLKLFQFVNANYSPE